MLSTNFLWRLISFSQKSSHDSSLNSRNPTIIVYKSAQNKFHKIIEPASHPFTHSHHPPRQSHKLLATQHTRRVHPLRLPFHQTKSSFVVSSNRPRWRNLLHCTYVLIDTKTLMPELPLRTHPFYLNINQIRISEPFLC